MIGMMAEIFIYFSIRRVKESEHRAKVIEIAMKISGLPEGFV
jgi:hypothetical protein